MSLKNKKILIVVGGGISAYKSLDLIRLLKKNNVDVKTEEDENLIKDALVRQLFSSVRWVETIEFMEQQGVDTMLELGPGKVLTSFNKRIDNSIKSLSVSDPNSLESALETLSSL